MAAWYVGSVQYAAVAQFQVSHAYIVGDIVRQLAAPAVDSERCFRCTTAGTSAGSEPAWGLTKGSTTTSGTAVFTEVTGNSTYAWAAPCARLALVLNGTTFAANGDTIYVAQNHAETQATSITYNGGSSAAPKYLYCVNAAGSVPPVPADLATTATVSATGASNIAFRGFWYAYGIKFSAGSGSSDVQLLFCTGSSSDIYLDSSLLTLNTTSVNAELTIGATNILGTTNLINTPIVFGSTSQRIALVTGRFNWLNTPSAIQGSVPTTLFIEGSGRVCPVYCDGVDFSAMGSGKTIVGDANVGTPFNLVNCKLGASVTVATPPTARGGIETNLIISDSGATGYRQERVIYEGALTTETTYTRVGGASDGVTPISWKVVTTSTALRQFPFSCFQIAEWNTVTGSAVNATVEIQSTATLTDAEVWMEIEYLGTSGYPVSSKVSSGAATPLTTPANLPTSSAAWNGGLGGAVKQYLNVSFTPQMAGLVRATVYVGKASQTVYIDPRLTLT